MGTNSVVYFLSIPQSRLPVWQVDIEKVGNKQRTRIRSAPSKMAETSIVATPEHEVAKRRAAKEQLTSQASSKKSAPARGMEDKVCLDHLHLECSHWETYHI